MQNPLTGLSLALKQAQTVDHYNWRLGAALFRGGSLLAVGQNKTKNHPLYVDYLRCSVHAEVDVLNQVDDSAGCALYVGRITRGGNIGMARPCDRCMEAIIDARVGKVIYTVDGHTFGFIRVNALAEGDEDGEKIRRLTTRNARCIERFGIKATARNPRKELCSR